MEICNKGRFSLSFCHNISVTIIPEERCPVVFFTQRNSREVLTIIARVCLRRKNGIVAGNRQQCRLYDTSIRKHRIGVRAGKDFITLIDSVAVILQYGTEQHCARVGAFFLGGIGEQCGRMFLQALVDVVQQFDEIIINQWLQKIILYAILDSFSGISKIVETRNDDDNGVRIIFLDELCKA